MLSKWIFICLFLFVNTAAKTQCFSVPGQVCANDCGPIFYLNNDPPGTTYAWSVSCGTITNATQANPHMACFLTPGVCTIQVIFQLPGEAPDTCIEMIDVLPNSISLIIETICEGDSIEINGTYYSEGMYNDTLIGAAANGCDSITLITVSNFPHDTTYVDYLGCEGDGYSVVVNSATYDESNPTGLETLPGDDGCDSTVIINLVFQPPSFGNEIYIGCVGDGYAVVVNNVVYDETHPTGTEILTGANGCDSVVTITLIYNPLRFNTINYSGCSGDGFSVVVDSILFDENNPSGVVVIVGGGCDSIVTVDLQFDTLIASLSLVGNQLCATPSGLNYTWSLCDSIALPDTTECITVNGIGCACVIVDNGTCLDTACLDFQFCDVICEIISPEGSCLGDSVLMTIATNATASAVIDWTITLDSFASVTYNNIDSLWNVFNTPGCYVIDVVLQDLGCLTFCSDTICVAEKPLGDLCCDQVACDTCVTLNVFLFGTPPWTIEISDGNSIDTISGITTSQYDYLSCPPYNTTVNYTLLTVQDSLNYCEGGIISNSVSVYVEQRPFASISIVGDSLCAQPSGFAYGWVDCGNTSNLSFNQCYVPTASGCYCVTVSTLITDCIDTACINYVFSGINPAEPEKVFEARYDPALHAIILSNLPQVNSEIQISLTDILGRKIYAVETTSSGADETRISLSDLHASLIFITVSGDSFRQTAGLFIPD